MLPPPPCGWCEPEGIAVLYAVALGVPALVALVERWWGRP